MILIPVLVVIDSYRRLESDRHRVLDLEKMLPFLFIGEHDPRALDLRSESTES